MNPIQKALSTIKEKIPLVVLERAYANNAENYYFRSNEFSLDQKILTKTIRGRVIDDMNLVGGQMVVIFLQDCQITYANAVNGINSMVVKVPKHVTAGRTIVSVHDVSVMTPSYAAMINASASYTYNTNSTECPCNNRSEVVAAVDRLLMSGGRPPIVSTADCEIIGENIISIRGQGANTGAYMRVFVTNDPELTNINPRSILDFVHLVQLAVKSYIYKTLIIQIGTDELQAGHAIGAFRTIIETYSDAEDQYTEFLTKDWARIAVMNDRKAYSAYLRMGISGL